MAAALQPVHLALVAVAVLLTAVPWYRRVPGTGITGVWPRTRTILAFGLVLLLLAALWEWGR